ncbi:MAG: zinc ribbon domain-containing protein [bacterium]
MKCPRCGSEAKEGVKFCSKCGGKLEGPQAPAPPAARPSSAYNAATSAMQPQQTSNRFGLNKYLFNQRLLKIRSTYQVYDETGGELFYIQRLTFALKRHIYVYSDSSMNNKILTILQDKFIAILYMPFTLQDASGQTLAKFRRRNMISILRRTWDIQSADGEVIGQAVEDSWGKALFRRFGPLGEYFKTDFIITFGGRVIGKYIRRWTVLDKYLLDLSEDPQQTFDRRAALALGVLLDSGEAR